MWRRTDLASYRAGSPQWETVLSVDALNRAEGESWVYKGHTLYRPRDGSPPTRTLMELSRGGADAVVLRELDPDPDPNPNPNPNTNPNPNPNPNPDPDPNANANPNRTPNLNPSITICYNGDHHHTAHS